jgi:predicted transcriptional regulator
MDCTHILDRLARLQARIPNPQPRTLLKAIAQRIDAEAEAGRITAGEWAELRRRVDRLTTKSRRQRPAA